MQFSLSLKAFDITKHRRKRYVMLLFRKVYKENPLTMTYTQVPSGSGKIGPLWPQYLILSHPTTTDRLCTGLTGISGACFNRYNRQ